MLAPPCGTKGRYMGPSFLLRAHKDIMIRMYMYSQHTMGYPMCTMCEMG